MCHNRWGFFDHLFSRFAGYRFFCGGHWELWQYRHDDKEEQWIQVDKCIHNHPPGSSGQFKILVCEQDGFIVPPPPTPVNLPLAMPDVPPKKQDKYRSIDEDWI